MEMELMLQRDHQNIPCKISEPDNGTIRRVVMGVHGFGGSMDDAIQVAIAEEMELFYAATIRFDFPAHGDSPLESEALTLQNCIDTLLYVAQWAHNRYPDLDFCIFFSSFCLVLRVKKS